MKTFLKVILFTALFAIVCFVALLGVLFLTPKPLKFVLDSMKNSGVHYTDVQGNLMKGFQISGLSIDDSTQNFSAAHLEITYELSNAQSSGIFTIKNLIASDVSWIQKETPKVATQEQPPRRQEPNLKINGQSGPMTVVLENIEFKNIKLRTFGAKTETQIDNFQIKQFTVVETNAQETFLSLVSSHLKSNLAEFETGRLEWKLGSHEFKIEKPIQGTLKKLASELLTQDVDFVIAGTSKESIEIGALKDSVKLKFTVPEKKLLLSIHALEGSQYFANYPKHLGALSIALESSTENVQKLIESQAIPENTEVSFRLGESVFTGNYPHFETLNLNKQPLKMSGPVNPFFYIQDKEAWDKVKFDVIQNPHKSEEDFVADIWFQKPYKNLSIDEQQVVIQQKTRFVFPEPLKVQMRLPASKTIVRNKKHRKK